MYSMSDWRTRLAGVALLVSATWCGAAVAAGNAAESAAPIPCGTFYMTQRGDSLHSIAKRAYGWGKYPAVYLANRDVLPDLSVLPIGVQLLVPCLDGTGPRNRREALAALPDIVEPQVGPETFDPPAPLRVDDPPLPEALGPMEPEAPVQASIAPAPEPAKAVEPAPQAEPVRLLLLTGRGLSPLSDGDLRGGGLIPQLVSRSIKLIAPTQPFKVTFVNDWDAHLQGLLLSGALDVGFPWVKPDCSRRTGLDAQGQLLCSEFQFSNPMYEVAIAFYVRKDDRLREGVTLDSLSGKRLCRPARSYAFGIELPDPVATGTSLQTAPSATACFERLLRGETDVVMVVRAEAEQELRESRIAGGAREIKSLVEVRSLHAIAPRAHPHGSEFLALINEGMEQLMMSGEWFQIVAAHHSSQVASVE